MDNINQRHSYKQTILYFNEQKNYFKAIFLILKKNPLLSTNNLQIIFWRLIFQPFKNPRQHTCRRESRFNSEVF